MIKEVYNKLLNMYGLQGWWPLSILYDKSHQGYHPGDYSYPHSKAQMFEICVGSILTQNTSWTNVEKAVLKLQENNVLDPYKILNIEKEKLGEIIKPAGYFNQKAKKLKEFASFFINLKGKTPSREDLLEVWGIGPETADSILLYAYSLPEFVVDTYTRRIFLNLGLISQSDSYDDIKNIFEKNLDKDYKLFQEYHALLVEHAKRYYVKNNKTTHCPLKELFT